MRRQKRAEATHLSHKDVVHAALRIIDHDGLNGLSIRKLGMHLGVDPMAIYYYFPNKQAVLDGIMEAVMSEITIPDTLGPSWVEDLPYFNSFFPSTLLRNVGTVKGTAVHPRHECVGAFALSFP
jgi:AcrR family transcriptional regulator